MHELAVGILEPGNPSDAISWLLPRLISRLDTRRACFFKLHPFNSYQEWRSTPTDPCRSDARPSPTLLDAIESIGRDAPVSANGTARPQTVDGLLLIPVVHRQHCIACLGIDAAEVNEAHSRETVHLLTTVALMLGQILLHNERQQRETLIREVHHRIKNNLQGILGLLRQELGGQPALAGAMENAIGKVRSIAIIHGLQSRGAHGEIYLCEIVEAIVHAVRDVLGKSINLQLETNIDPPLKILPEEAVPVALILNELLTNAIKHAVAGDSVPNTCVEFTTQQDRGVIRVRNTAVSICKDFDLASGKGLGTGLELVRSLLPHHGANLEILYVDTLKQVEASLVLTAPIVMAAGKGDRPPVCGKKIMMA